MLPPGTWSDRLCTRSAVILTQNTAVGYYMCPARLRNTVSVWQSGPHSTCRLRIFQRVTSDMASLRYKSLFVGNPNDAVSSVGEQGIQHF
jgi:hypothetical protein